MTRTVSPSPGESSRSCPTGRSADCAAAASPAASRCATAPTWTSRSTAPRPPASSPHLDRAEVLLGPRVDVADVKSLCAEARFCHRDGAVWHRVGEDSDEAAETVVAECRLCPSGRYTALDKATGEPLEPELPAVDRLRAGSAREA